MVRVTPTEAYDLTGVLRAELTRIKWHLGVNVPGDEITEPARRRDSTDVFAQMLLVVSGLDSGNTAWVTTSTALVLFMTIPGLALFYGGLVRANNVVSVLLQCFAITCIVSVLWFAVGYSLAFGNTVSHVIGDMSRSFYQGVTEGAMIGTIPESIFATFQLTFAIIAPALIVGAFVERMRFSAVLLFTVAWSLLVYSPVAHWVWGGGWLGQLGFLDYAGGTVVHVTAGTAALVAATVLGPRQGFPDRTKPPHSMVLAVVGAAMLWVGWFGFNGGSALGANGDATIGMISGLASITPASGFVGPVGAFVMGTVGSFICSS